MPDDEDGMSQFDNEDGKEKPKHWINGGPIPPDPNRGGRNGTDNVYRLNGKRPHNHDNDPPWKKDWQRSDSGTPLANLRNVMIVLRNYPPLKDIIKFNEMTQSVWLMGHIPNTPEDTTIPRPIQSEDILSI